MNPISQRVRKWIAPVALIAAGAVAWSAWYLAGPKAEDSPRLMRADGPLKKESSSRAGPSAALEAECQRLWQQGRANDCVDAVLRWAGVADARDTSLVEWLHRLPKGAERDRLVIEVASELTVVDRLKLLPDIGSPEKQRDLLAAVIGAWATDDVPAARQWLEQHRDNPAHAAGQVSLAGVWAASQPREAAAYVAREMAVGPEQDRAAVVVVQHWSQTAPLAAGAWVCALPPGEIQSTAAEELVRIWSTASREEPGVWLLSLPDGSLRDRALSAFARVLAVESPQQAREWAFRINDERTMMACVESILALEKVVKYP